MTWYCFRMSTVEEVTTAVRRVAAHEARFAVSTERIDEMRDHPDQAGLRLQAAEAQIQAGGNMSEVREVHTQQGDARQLQRHGSHETLRH